MKKSNNIISDWLEKYGDPKIDKKVEMELERITKERYNQIIDESHKSYVNEWTFEKYPNDGSVYSVEPIKVKEHSKEQFVYRCKTDTEFSEKWGLKIEERLLKHIERKKLMDDYTDSRNMFRIGYQVTIDGFNYDKYNEVCDKYNIPSKLITITYNNETLEIYE